MYVFFVVTKIEEVKYLLSMSLLKQHGFLLVVKIMNIFIAYGLQVVLRVKELEKSY